MVKRTLTELKLLAMIERRLQGYDFLALFPDGKAFADDAMVIALGLTLQGEGVVLSSHVGYATLHADRSQVGPDNVAGTLASGDRPAVWPVEFPRCATSPAAERRCDARSRG